jgi:hypothetical protein
MLRRLLQPEANAIIEDAKSRRADFKIRVSEWGFRKRQYVSGVCSFRSYDIEELGARCVALAGFCSEKRSAEISSCAAKSIKW